MWNEKEITTHYAPHITHFIYRPLLNTTRAEFLTYARENNLEWREDESNSDVKFARNKVRHEFLPQLEKESPGAATQLCRIALLADKAYAKVMNAGESLFAPVLRAVNADADIHQHDMWAGIALDKKKLRKVLLAHESTDLSEMFRLWLSEQGFRFPIGFFYSQTEPAHVKIPVRAAYRKRSIVKKGSTVLICEFESVEAALKFVSCK
jgi:tRNA(Ile)-lysidine synthase